MPRQVLVSKYEISALVLLPLYPASRKEDSLQSRLKNDVQLVEGSSFHPVYPPKEVVTKL